MMTFQFWNAFRTFSADVLLIALGVTFTVSLLKKTVMKHCNRKTFVFLPFLIGIVFYAVYRALVTMSALPFTEEIFTTVEKGFSCGLAATLYYVVYEQFFRAAPERNKPFDPLPSLIAGTVPEEKRTEAANAIREAVKNAEGREPCLAIREVLESYAVPELTETEKEILVQVLAKYFSFQNMTA